MIADRRPTVGGPSFDFQSTVCSDCVFVHDNDGNNLFKQDGLSESIQTGSRSDVHACHVVKIERFRSSRKDTSVFTLPSSVCLIATNAR